MKGESPPSPIRRQSFRLGWVFGLLGVSWALRYLFPDGVLFNPPYCAWRFIGNGDAWNVAYPDAKSIYHVMQLRIGEHDIFKIVGESFPYARYMSYQTYDIPDFMSQMSVRDVDIVPDFGINAYNNLTAAKLGEKQGGYTVYITPHGDKNYTNELRALPDKWKAGNFDLFFRIYMEDGPAPPQAPWGHLPAGGELDADKWGWAPPPRLYVLRRSKKPEEEEEVEEVVVDGERRRRKRKKGPPGEEAGWREIPMCTYRRRTGFKWVAYLAELAKPALKFTSHNAPNRVNNVFLPKYSDRGGKFASKDANYIAALVDTNKPGKKVFARMSGRWPRTAGSLYTPPYVANFSDYEVRYASISSGSRNPPFMNFGTVSDSALVRHFTAKAQERGEEWDGKFVLWLVPPEVEKLPEEVTRDQGMILEWGRDPWTGRSVYSPGILYRQVMAQSQVLPPSEQEPHPSGIANIVPETCDSAAQPRRPTRRRREEGGPEEDGEPAGEQDCRDGQDGSQGTCPQRSSWGGGVSAEMEGVCCGRATAPSHCFRPAFVQHRMGEYYPKIEFYSASVDDPSLSLTLINDHHEDGGGDYVVPTEERDERQQQQQQPTSLP